MTANDQAEGFRRDFQSPALAISECQHRWSDHLPDFEHMTADLLGVGRGWSVYWCTSCGAVKCHDKIALPTVGPKLYAALDAMCRFEDEAQHAFLPINLEARTRWYIDRAVQWNQMLDAANAALREARGEAVR